MIIGDALLTLCRIAQQELLLVAPFVKVTVLERILIEVPESIPVRCVTRWYPHEVAAGVSDLEVWPLLRDRAKSSLWLRPDLHAKYYRVDRQCLVGSANLTATALGLREPANLELLLSYPAETPELQAFETTLFAQAIPANESIYQQMRAAVQHLPKLQAWSDDLIDQDDIQVGDESTLGIPPETTLEGEPITPELRQLRESEVVYERTPGQEWFPQTRHPEDLYKAYANHWERLSLTTQIAAAYDLQFLAIPPGINKEGFRTCVGAMLLQHAVVQRIDALATTPQRFGAVKNVLAARYKQRHDFDAGYGWQTLMRWLLFFLPQRYSVSTPRHSEIFRRII